MRPLVYFRVKSGLNLTGHESLQNRTSMELITVKKSWFEAEKQEFRGWDFSHLEGRWEESPLPWNYLEIINQHRQPEHSLLDMGTGGGEFLLSIGHPHHLTSVTEGYPPNYDLCRRHLYPLGIEVRQISDDSNIPYANRAFDLVINRHESFDAGEVWRVLKPGGIFITQQVGGMNNRNLAKILILDFEPLFPHHHLAENVTLLSRFEVLRAEEFFGEHKFFDLEALIHFARISEWEFPEFSVNTCCSGLCQLDKILTKNGFVSGILNRFIIVARKPSF